MQDEVSPGRRQPQPPEAVRTGDLEDLGPVPRDDLHMATTHHPDTGTSSDTRYEAGSGTRASSPDNLAEPPLDSSEDWRSRPLRPLDEETVPARSGPDSRPPATGRSRF